MINTPLRELFYLLTLCVPRGRSIVVNEDYDDDNSEISDYLESDYESESD
jgi:hypothetical protein